MASETLYKVFVYGTLKKGEPNHQWLSKSIDVYYKFLYKAKTKEKFPLIIATGYNIPFLLYAPGHGHNVQGEVYEVDNNVLKNLDQLEEHPDFYFRDQYDVENLDDQSQIEKVWIYVIKKFRKELLNQTFYVNYSSNDSHGLQYVARYLRGENFDHRKQICPNYETTDE